LCVRAWPVAGVHSGQISMGKGLEGLQGDEGCQVSM
jgi:hypothetical protein